MMTYILLALTMLLLVAAPFVVVAELRRRAAIRSYIMRHGDVFDESKDYARRLGYLHDAVRRDRE